MPLSPLAEGDRKEGRKSGGISHITHGKIGKVVAGGVTSFSIRVSLRFSNSINVQIDVKNKMTALKIFLPQESKHRRSGFGMKQRIGG